MRVCGGVLVLAAMMAAASPATADEASVAAAAARGDTLPIGPAGLTVTVARREGWAPMTGDEAPKIDVSQVPGAGVSLRRGWTRRLETPAPHEDRLILVCAEAPSDHYVAGAESLVFDRMNALAKATLPRSSVTLIFPLAVTRSVFWS